MGLIQGFLFIVTLLFTVLLLLPLFKLHRKIIVCGICAVHCYTYGMLGPILVVLVGGQGRLKILSLLNVTLLGQLLIVTI